jgi:hypothetical protein
MLVQEDALNNDPKKEEKKKPKSKNNIPNLKDTQQAEIVELDLDSPRLIQAMENLRFTKEDFEKKHNFRNLPDDGKDVLELRKKHYYTRVMENINHVLEERRRISKLLLK